MVDQGEGGWAGSSSKHHISSPLTGPPMRAGSLEELEAGGWNVEKRRERDKQGDITTSSLGLFPEKWLIFFIKQKKQG